jgi:hypothetical protein
MKLEALNSNQDLTGVELPQVVSFVVTPLPCQIEAAFAEAPAAQRAMFGGDA